jgi:hypothetical protein
MSWGRGSRWGNNYYEFSNLQYFWSTLSTLIFAIVFIIVIFKYLQI